ncbi:MAG: YfcE family phosphodiesterase [Dehalococcoidales bacterium]
MRIGLISDTHIPEVGMDLPGEVLEHFRGVDLILHGGDIYDPKVLDELEKIAPVLAAKGDDDYAKAGQRVKVRHSLELEGYRVWLTHIRQAYLTERSWLEQTLPQPEEEEEGSPDIFIFGHEHRTVVEKTDGVLYICSGSPTLLNYKRGMGTIGILELNSGEPKIDIIQL